MYSVLFFLQFFVGVSVAVQSRYALCLSGGIRTFTYTIPRYIEFIEANVKNGGVDIFLYIYDDSPIESTSIVNGIPDSVTIEVRQFLMRPEVVKYVFEIDDVFPKLKRDLGIQCANVNQNRMLSCIMQANKILQAMLLVNDHVTKKRNGDEYSLIIRSRPDILFPPQVLDLSKFDSVVRHDREKIIDDGNGQFQHKFRDQLNTKFKTEAKVIANYLLKSKLNSLSSSSGSSGSVNEGTETTTRSNQTKDMEFLSSESPRFLFIPMCGDWNGVNDQFAIGTTDAMNDYAQRLYTWKYDHPIMKASGQCEGDSDRHTLMNILGRIAYTKVYRFVFDYTLLREKNIESFKLNPESYQEVRSIISAGVNGLNDIADVGTTCARNPIHVNGFKDLRRQVGTSGRKEWTATMLKCLLLPSEQSISPTQGKLPNKGIVGGGRPMGRTNVREGSVH